MEKVVSKDELNLALQETTTLKAKAKQAIVIQTLQTLENSISEKISNLSEETVKPTKVEEPTKVSLIKSKGSETKKTESDTTVYKPIKSFAWDQDGFNGKKVFIYVTLNGVGAVKDNVSCDFDTESFDLKVMGLDGVNYRMLQRPLFKEIVVDKCRFKVKDNRVVITLQKTEGEYGTDNWTELIATRGSKSKKKKDDPTGNIMDMMRKMYDEGDDKMRKTIGEAMLKSRQENRFK